MSLLENLFSEITGSSSNETSNVEHPCSNCPSSCAICPDACSVCQPYKEKLIDAIYNVEHKDELLAKYEVTGTAGTADATVKCPACGANSADPYVCEYCGTKLADGTSKIKVASANDLPNPVLDAQDIIFERYEAISKYVDADESNGIFGSLFGDSSSRGVLGSIFNIFSGADNDGDDMGCKMTESEIEQMAEEYGVSVSAYLTGLDNGRYLTLSAKNSESKRNAAYTQNRSILGTGAAGLAGAGAGVGIASIISNLTNNNSKNNSAYNRNGRPEPPDARGNMNRGGMDRGGQGNMGRGDMERRGMSGPGGQGNMNRGGMDDRFGGPDGMNQDRRGGYGNNTSRSSQGSSRSNSNVKRGGQDSMGRGGMGGPGGGMNRGGGHGGPGGGHGGPGR